MHSSMVRLNRKLSCGVRKIEASRKFKFSCSEPDLLAFCLFATYGKDSCWIVTLGSILF